VRRAGVADSVVELTSFRASGRFGENSDIAIGLV
jgi:hypothetical protein